MKTLSRAGIAPVLGVLAVLAISACGSSSSTSSSASNTGAGTSTPATTTAAGGSANAIVSNPANAKTTITVGSKNFTEEYILGNIYAQALKAAGYAVKTQLNLGSEQIAYKALVQGTIDGYPEYTGTALTSFFNVPITKVPKSDQAAYLLAKADYAKHGIAALAPSPFTDGEGMAITKAESQKLGGVTTISQLAAKSAGLTFTGAPECRQRTDCLVGLQQVYHVKFTFKPVAISTFYPALDSGQAQASEVFTTDGALSSGKYVLLTDDKHLYPPDNVTFSIRKSVLAKAGPDLQKVIEEVQSGLTTPAMQELNARVDLQKQTPDAVATEYLKESGYIK
jgi:glycine betaine/choline ABC-type transport system substrate-binding protein